MIDSLEVQVLFTDFHEWKRLPQLPDDPTARRMLREINVQDAPPITTDDEEAVEHLLKREKFEVILLVEPSTLEVFEREVCPSSERKRIDG